MFFNSKIFKYAFKEYFPELLGDSRELRKIFFETVSVLHVKETSWFKNMCMTIIEAKNNNLPTEYYELEVDEKLFELYELTETEISLILSSFNTILSIKEISKSVSS